MSNPQKARGTKWERAVLAFCREHIDPRAYKPRQEGHKDIGDVHAGDLVIQCKDWKSWEAAIREGLDGARVQAVHAAASSPPHVRYGVAVVKRARRPVGDAYVVMALDDFAELVYALAATD